MKFIVTMTDNDGGFIEFEVEAENWDKAIGKAEEKSPGWEVITLCSTEGMIIPPDKLKRMADG